MKRKQKVSYRARYPATQQQGKYNLQPTNKNQKVQILTRVRKGIKNTFRFVRTNEEKITKPKKGKKMLTRRTWGKRNK